MLNPDVTVSTARLATYLSIHILNSNVMKVRMIISISTMLLIGAGVQQVAHDVWFGQYLDYGHMSVGGTFLFYVYGALCIATGIELATPEKRGV